MVRKLKNGILILVSDGHSNLWFTLDSFIGSKSSCLNHWSPEQEVWLFACWFVSLFLSLFFLLSSFLWCVCMRVANFETKQLYMLSMKSSSEPWPWPLAPRRTASTKRHTIIAGPCCWVYRHDPRMFSKIKINENQNNYNNKTALSCFLLKCIFILHLLVLKK